MNAANVERKPELEMVEDMERHDDAATQVGRDDVIHNKELLEEAFAAETHEHSMTVWQAAKSYPAACIWAFIMAFTIVMESFDMFLIGNFVALPAFYNKYGVDQGDGKGFVIPTRWQTSLSQAGQIGAFLGVFLAPPITNRLGYRWTALIGLMLMNATIFISFFADSLPVFLVGQLFEGIPWGFFISMSPAYCSEIVPIPLRGAVTATLQMSWAIGSIIVGAATYVLNQRTDEWAYRIPLAIQWIFPTPLMVLIWFAPESPWWLVRHGRPEEALKSITRLGRRSKIQDPKDTLAMMARTVEIEAHLSGTPTYLDLVKGSDFRRTAITCLVYASQNFVGNLIANQSVYFFEQAGMTTDFAFALGLITSCLQLFGVACSWFLSAWFGRRTIYLLGAAINMALLFSLGIAASVHSNQASNYAQACLGVIISFVFALTLGPISYTIISETSTLRLRPLTTGVGRAAYYVAEVPLIWLSSQMLNPTGWNLQGKCGYIWGGTTTVCFIIAFFGLPEMKGKSYREIDILYKRRVPARKFKSTVIDIHDNE